MSESSLPNVYAPAGDTTRADAEDLHLERHAFEFHGSAAEYFRIWVVNIALSIITLGVYSAWAKVRNKQYFYGNSRLAGGSFEYTANPVNILKGRVIVFSVFVAYNVASTFQPLLAVGLLVLIVPLVPWMIVNAVRFNHRYSAYRNLRFHFDAGYWEAFRVYVLWTLAIALSFGLAYPFVAWRRKRMLVERSRFGNGHFSYRAEVGYFYLVYILAGIIYTGAIVALMVIVTAGGFALSGTGAFQQLAAQDDGYARPELLLVIAAAVGYLGFFVAFIVFNTGIQAAISNYVWSNTRLEEIRFKLELGIPQVVWIQISNIAAIIISLGLLIPWAKVRMIRYRLSCFTMLAPQNSIDGFVAAQREAVTATGGEFGDALDLDLGL